MAIGSLLFVEWANAQRSDNALAVRLGAIIPHLHRAVKHGHLGPDRYAAHRVGQRDNYYHHRDAATYELALHRDDDGLYVAVERRVLKGRWDDDATLFEAATVAPYEALLRLDAPDGPILLDWLALAIDRWLVAEEARFPVQSWSLDERLPAP